MFELRHTGMPGGRDCSVSDMTAGMVGKELGEEMVDVLSLGTLGRAEDLCNTWQEKLKALEDRE